MITKYQYEILKMFRDSKDGITEEEYKDYSSEFYHKYGFPPQKLYDMFVGDEFITTRDCNRYEISHKGINEIENYERWLNYKPKMVIPKTGAGYVIVEHKSGTFGTGTYKLNYTRNIGLTRSLSNAKMYASKEDAEKDIEWFWNSTPSKHQNPEDYDFSVEEVTLTINVKLPTTFICKDCGKELPIKDYFVSTYCPESWNTGVCPNCISFRKIEERKQMFGDRNKRGVFDYDSL
jgi:hypothetical protein